MADIKTENGWKQVWDLFKLLVGLILIGAGSVFLAWQINPVLGTIWGFFTAVGWFVLAPRIAGRMLAAMILARRAGKARNMSQ